MRLSKKTEYALKALIYAARHPEGTTFQIKELAERNGIPKKFLELIRITSYNVCYTKLLRQTRAPPRVPPSDETFSHAVRNASPVSSDEVLAALEA